MDPFPKAPSLFLPLGGQARLQSIIESSRLAHEKFLGSGSSRVYPQRYVASHAPVPLPPATMQTFILSESPRIRKKCPSPSWFVLTLYSLESSVLRRGGSGISRVAGVSIPGPKPFKPGHTPLPQPPTSPTLVLHSGSSYPSSPGTGKQRWFLVDMSQASVGERKKPQGMLRA